jgi:GNAT superfamily N-acetyltransferase
MQARNVMTSTDIARLVEFTEAAAYADMLRATPKPWSCIEERTPAGWFLLTPRIDTLLFNRVLCCGLDQPVTRTDISSWLERYKAAGVHSYGVQVSPALQPASATQLLVQEGLRRHDSWTKVYRAAEPVVETAGVLRVERAGPAQAAMAARIACVAFGMSLHVSSWLEGLVDRPGWRHYLAWDDDDPVGTAAMFVHHDIGWLGIAGTVPAARRRGAQTALMARRLIDGAAEGCRWFVTETGEDLPERPNSSFRNMVRAGFQIAYKRPNFMPGLG